MGKCESCEKEVMFPFKCTYCGKTYCEEHRLPEYHQCQYTPQELKYWRQRKKALQGATEREQGMKKEESPATQPKESKPKARHVKKVIIALVIVVPMVLLGLIFIPRLIMPTPNTVNVDNIPFEDDFHLSKNIFSQGGAIRYLFNVTYNARRIDVNIMSTKEINFKLIYYENGSTVIEKDWVMSVYISPLLKKGNWIVQIEAFYSEAEGVLTLNYGFMSWMEFISYDVERQDSSLTMTYKDDLNETVSVHISIKTRSGYEYVEVWSRIKNGTDRNNFAETWTGENKDYIIYFTVNHELFGELTWSEVSVAPFSSPYYP